MLVRFVCDFTLLQYKYEARKAVKAVWTSPWQYERSCQFYGDETYALSLWYTSQQWDMASQLQPCLGGHGHAPRISLTKAAPLSCFLQHLRGSPLVNIAGPSTPQHENHCIGLFSIWNTERAENMKKVHTLITLIPFLTSVGLVSDDDSVWNEWSQGDYSHLQCALVYAHRTNISLHTICKPLQRSQYLDTLSLHWTTLKEMSMAALSSLPALTHLRLEGCSVYRGEIDMTSLCNVIYKGKLTWLHLDFIKLDDHRAAELSECLKTDQCKLKGLLLKICGMSVYACQLVCKALAHNKHINTLDFSGNRFGDDPMSEVCHLLARNTTITELDISETWVTDVSGLCYVLQISSSLRILDLSGLGSSSRCIISQLCGGIALNSSLHALLMKSCGLNDTSVKKLTAILTNNRCLKVLSLCHNHDIKASCMVELIQKSSLEVLDVTGCHIFEDDMHLRSTMKSDHSGNCSCGVCRLVKAVCASPSLQVLGLGDFTRAAQGATFLGQLHQRCPHIGQLHAIYINDMDRSVSEAAAALAKELNNPCFIQYGGLGNDLVANTGQRWCSLPPDKCKWLSHFVGLDP